MAATGKRTPPAELRTLHRVRRAVEHYRRARRDRDDAIRAAVADGASLRGVADVAGLSHERIRQIAAE